MDEGAHKAGTEVVFPLISVPFLNLILELAVC